MGGRPCSRLAAQSGVPWDPVLGCPEIVKVMFWSYLLILGGVLLLFLVTGLRHT
jgi:hypothetical protein